MNKKVKKFLGILFVSPSLIFTGFLFYIWIISLDKIELLSTLIFLGILFFVGITLVGINLLIDK